MIDFAALPPEISSAKMYAGPGASPLLATATAWDALSTGLTEAAAGYASTLASLATAWTGQSAIAMSQAALRYQGWLTATAAQASETATRAMAAVASFETAYAATVAPELVAANRSLLATLVATNFLGVNTAAIAATEAQYMEMWAQDAAAMLEYQAQSLQAATLPTFTLPPAIANPIQDFLSSPWTYLLGGQTLPQLFWSTVQSNLSSGPWQAAGQTLALMTGLWTANAVTGPNSPLAAALGDSPATSAPCPEVCPTGGGTYPIQAAVGAGRQIGPMSVPPSWAQPQRVANPLSEGVPLAVSEDTLATPMPMAMPMALGGEKKQTSPEYGVRPRIMSRCPSGG